MRHTVRVGSGPGTSGYDRMTPTQKKKTTAWAAFTLSSDAQRFAELVRSEHPTWTVAVVDVELVRYQREQAEAK